MLTPDDKRVVNPAGGDRAKAATPRTTCASCGCPLTDYNRAHDATLAKAGVCEYCDRFAGRADRS